MRKCLQLIFIALVVVMSFSSTTLANATNSHWMRVTVTEDGVETPYMTTATTVGDLFEEYRITLEPDDICNVSTKSILLPEMNITIKRAIYVNVLIGGVSESVRVEQDCVLGALVSRLSDERGEGYLLPGNYSSTLTDGQTVKLQVIKQENYIRAESIPYETEYVYTRELLEGNQEIAQEGAEGILETGYAVYYLDGVEQSRNDLESTVTLEPVTHIVKIGTGKTIGMKTDVTSDSFQYLKKLTMVATAYTAGPESTGKNPGDRGYGITSTGRKVTKGVVATDPRVIPMGTKLYVEGYGYAIAADVGSAIKDARIDLYFESLTDARKYGRKTITVYVVDDYY